VGTKRPPEERIRKACPYCEGEFVLADLRDHVANVHPLEKQFSRSKIKRLAWRQVEKERQKRTKERTRKRLESLPPIMCHSCGQQIPRGKFKIHLVEVHGASPIILQKPKKPTKKKSAKFENRKFLEKLGYVKSDVKVQYANTNILHPLQGGLPGSGKRK